ncbi:MAG: hypothetical protein BWX52_01051 [Bacteroidetes bacterium ADurb.Bin013]|jgi:hypothetical protein|nr:MAG: hypothetical protein BWX52_01051 [Bacteroidetes bacterium ADurb.Bin013]
MIITDQLKSILGLRTTSVWVNRETEISLSPHQRGVRLCEVVNLSFNGPKKSSVITGGTSARQNSTIIYITL